MNSSKDGKYADFIDYILNNIKDEEELANWSIERYKQKNENSIHDSTEQSQDAETAG